MHTVSYSHGAPGGWIAIARTGRLLAIQGQRADAEIAEWWHSMAAGASVQSLLEQLIRDGISKAPSFAVLEWENDSVHAIVRGTVTLAIDGITPQTLSGHGVSTWVEARVAGIAGARLDLGVGAESAIELPLADGVAWVSSLAIGAATAAAPAAPPAAPLAAVEVVASTQPGPILPPPPPPPPPPAAPAPVPTVGAESDGIAESTMVERTSAYEEPPAAVAGSAYAHLFGETVMRSVEGAAVRASGGEKPADGAPEPTPAAPPPPPASVATPDGLHDGQTVLQEEVLAMKAARKQRARPVATPVAPPAFTLTSRAGVEDLATPVIIGRAPSVSKVSRDDIPRLVTISGKDQDISRNHVRIAVEGGTVVVTDLESRNGTQITMPGRPTQQLRPGEPVPVLPGTVIDLGGGVTYTVSAG